MTSKYVQPGLVIDFVAPAAALSGAMVKFGARVGLMVSDVGIGETASALVAGVVTYTKKAADVMAQGALVYFDSAANELTVTSAGNTLAGYAWVAAGAGITTVQVSLNA
jgi:predicted RecA/RadA family phage recombinase